MRKPDIIQKDKKLTVLYLIAIISSAVWMILGIVFIAHSGYLSRLEISDHVQAASAQTAGAVDSHIEEEFSILAATALVMQARWNDADREVSFRRLVHSLMEYNSYVLVGIAGPDGGSLISDRQGRVYEANVLEEPYFQRAMEGEHVLSDPVNLAEGDEQVHYYAVPVYREDRIIGVLYAADPIGEMRDIVDDSIYNGRGLAHIINSEGNYVVQSNSPLSMGIGNNIFEVNSPLPPAMEREILDDLAAGRAGHFERYVYDGNRYIAYEPLAKNQWYVFYVVPEYMLNARLNFVIGASITVLAVAAVVFILFTLLIWNITSRWHRDLEQEAFVDPLTRQHNNRKFMLDAGRLLRQKRPEGYSLWYYNIRGFKYINALFGHEVGDRMLQYLAEHLAEQIGEGEVFGRAHDDVFFLLRKCGKNDDELKECFEEDARYLASFPELAGVGFHAELDAGVYRIEPEAPPEPLKDMMNWAQAAHDAAKIQCGAQFGVYSSEMRQQKLWEAEMEARQETALENGEFEVYWQPKVAIQSGENIHGMESLVRWNFPGRGVISPSQYIPVFEQNGFIVKLDLFVFEGACRQYAAHELWRGAQPLVMSVNVSRIGMLQPDFVETYTAIKNRYGIPPGSVELEFTESLAFENHDQLADIITALHENGFLCSLDDFGAGYSSLNILKSLRVDVLKLDRQFFLFGGEVERGFKLVEGIITLANAMGMHTIAEGVEEKDTVDMLRQIGCDMIQGYVYAKPLALDDFILFLRNWAPAEDVGQEPE